MSRFHKRGGSDAGVPDRCRGGSVVIPSSLYDRVDTILVGSILMTLWYVLSSRLLLISQSYTIYAGAVGGFVAAVLFEERWDDGLESGFVAGLVAAPLTVSLLVAYDIVITSRYDIQITNIGRMSARPESLLSKVFVYGTYEAVFGLFPLVLFLVGGIAGGLGGGKLGGIVRSRYRGVEDPDAVAAGEDDRRS